MRLDSVYQVHAACVNTVCLPTDRRVVLTAAQEWDHDEQELFGVVKVWVPGQGLLKAHRAEGYDSRISASPAGDRVVWSGMTGRFRVMDGTTGAFEREVLLPEADESPARPALFSPDGSALFLRSSGGLLVLETGGWTVRTTIPLQERVTSVDIDLDGRRLAIGGVDGTAQVWDLDPLRKTHELLASDVHVRWVKFTADGVVTAGVDRPSRFWRLTGSSAACTHEPASDPVNALLTRDQDGAVVIGTATGAVEIWDPQAGRLVERYELKLPDHIPVVEEEGWELEDNPHPEVTSLALNDRSGQLAVGMMGGCVAFIDL